MAVRLMLARYKRVADCQAARVLERGRPLRWTLKTYPPVIRRRKTTASASVLVGRGIRSKEP